MSKRFLITIGTDYIGSDEVYKLELPDDSKLTMEDLTNSATDAAENLFLDCYLDTFVESLDIDPLPNGEPNWDYIFERVYEDIPFYSKVEEFNGTEEEWDELEEYLNL